MVALIPNIVAFRLKLIAFNDRLVALSHLLDISTGKIRKKFVLGELILKKQAISIDFRSNQRPSGNRVSEIYSCDKLAQQQGKRLRQRPTNNENHSGNFIQLTYTHSPYYVSMFPLAISKHGQGFYPLCISRYFLKPSISFFV